MGEIKKGECALLNLVLKVVCWRREGGGGGGGGGDIQMGKEAG